MTAGRKDNDELEVVCTNCRKLESVKIDAIQIKSYSTSCLLYPVSVRWSP